MLSPYDGGGEASAGELEIQRSGDGVGEGGRKPLSWEVRFWICSVLGLIAGKTEEARKSEGGFQAA